MGQQESILVDDNIKKANIIKDDLNIDELFNLFTINLDIPDHRDYYYKLNKILDDDIIYPSINFVNLLTDIENEYIENTHILNLLKLYIIYLFKLQGEDIIIPDLDYINYHTILLEYNNNQPSIRISVRNILKSINKNGIDIHNNCYHIEYFRIHNNIEEIKYHLSQNKILIINISLFTSFLKSKSLKKGIIDFPDDYDSILGLSLCLIIGYNNDDSFIIKLNNSMYGENGIFTITKQYLNLIKDIWLFHIVIDKKKKYGINQTFQETKTDIKSDYSNHNKIEDDNNIEDINYRRFIY